MKPEVKKDVVKIVSVGILFVVVILAENEYLKDKYFQFRSPIILQAPVVMHKVEKTISPLPKKQTSLINRVYAEEEKDTYVGSPEYEKRNDTWKSFVRAAYKLAPIYDYPVKVLLSQAALETGHGTSRIATQRNNFFGYNCNDGREDLDCTYFSTPEESIIEYMRLIKREPRYAEAYDSRTNPDEMISYIKAAGYATDKNYISKVMNMDTWRLVK